MVSRAPPIAATDFEAQTGKPPCTLLKARLLDIDILEKVKAIYDLPVVTDVHESHQCEAVGRVADIIQILAFLCRQTDLLVAAAKTGKIINIKKGQFCASSVMVNSAEKIRFAGNQNVMVCERGTMFGYSKASLAPFDLLVVDSNKIRGNKQS
ncbi:hypothetical protein PR202_gb00236 [Eleusine coracana subsp. coracana]|uniref:3-deoxy-8-phosphooctulonate synthase n=1 Tax=Eleusine coracana subsp. coracana TaxID=191504 RepID=A0AAV5DT78_ELECO|nr:hypothetical protein PR202_gb00236 [Eleusine coracana subsp. coracana]